MAVVPALAVASGCATVVKPAPSARLDPQGGRLPGCRTGLASWYGRWHHGRFTASGERFDMHQLSAAHRTLPFGTRVRVTNLENGRSVVVRVTDRGPYLGDRTIDLSREAARTLGMVDNGVARVCLDIL